MHPEYSIAINDCHRVFGDELRFINMGKYVED